jgi:nicotinamidase-related amidase
MVNDTPLQNSLMVMNDSILIVIDVQETFVTKLPLEMRDPLKNRIAWLMDVATRLNIPLVVTAEDIPNCGSVSLEIAKRLPPDIMIFNKMVFGLTAIPDIMAAIEGTGRKTTILVGLETDVCVAHSAIGLLQHGYRVVVVADATGSPGTGHEFGLERMRGAGVLISSVKGIYYEWIRSVARDNEFMKRFAQELGSPDGISL